VKRAQRKQRVFGGSWERVMRLALRVQDPTLPDGAVSMETIWGNPETPTVAQKVDAAVKLDQMGMPFRQNLEDLGYTPTQIERIQSMRDAGRVDASVASRWRSDRSSRLRDVPCRCVVGGRPARGRAVRVEGREGPGVPTPSELNVPA
jgi:hypothetical protein